MMRKQKKGKEYYLVAGLTQSGKSSMSQLYFKLEKIIVGENADGKSFTTQPCYNIQQGKKIVLIDTVGYQDTSDQNLTFKQIMDNTLKYCLDNGIKKLNGIIITISFNSLLQESNLQSIKKLLQSLVTIYKLDNVNSLIFCLTKGNLYSDEKKMKMKSSLVEKLKINKERIIEFLTNYKSPKTEQEIIYLQKEVQNFQKNLKKLSGKKMIDIHQPEQNIFELNTRDKHEGGSKRNQDGSEKVQMLKGPQEELLFLKQELYQLQDLKTLHQSKDYKKNTEETKIDQKKKKLKNKLDELLRNNTLEHLQNKTKNQFYLQNNLFRNEWTNNFLNFTNTKLRISKLAFLFTDNFISEINLIFKDDTIKLPDKIQLQDSIIIKWLFIQSLIENNDLNNGDLDQEFETFKTKKQENEKAKLYYKLISGEINSEQFKNPYLYDDQQEKWKRQDEIEVESNQWEENDSSHPNSVQEWISFNNFYLPYQESLE